MVICLRDAQCHSVSAIMNLVVATNFRLIFCYISPALRLNLDKQTVPDKSLKVKSRQRGRVVNVPG